MSQNQTDQITELWLAQLGGDYVETQATHVEYIFSREHTTVQVLMETMADGNYVSVYDNRFNGRNRQIVFIGENFSTVDLCDFLQLMGIQCQFQNSGN